MQVELNSEEAEHIKYLVEMSCRDAERRTGVEKSLIDKMDGIIRASKDATTARDDEEMRLLAEHRARGRR